MNNLEKKFYSFCTPAQVYLVFSIILMIITSISAKPSIKYIVIHTLYIMFWTLLLNFICYMGYHSVSWFILLLPIIFVGMALFVIGIDKMDKAIGLEQDGSTPYIF